MATDTSKKVTPGEIVLAVRKFNNSENETRKFDISLEANITGGKIDNINNGFLKRKEDAAGSATFNIGSDFKYFGFTSNGISPEDLKEAIPAIVAFVTDIKSMKEAISL